MPKVYDKVNAANKPDWLKTKLRITPAYAEVTRIVEKHGLHTICRSGRCPNQTECWSRRTATFMVLGDVCTRSCRFCATQTGRPLPPDPTEPDRVARSVALMGLRYAVLTSVTRDDLPDGGAAHWARTVEAVRRTDPATAVELLIPDMDGRDDLLQVVLSAGADVVGHNLETVERLTPAIRSRARYRTSLHVLERISRSGTPAKSGLMLGLGEREEEVRAALLDLREAGCRILTLGQYLQPSRAHWPVEAFVRPEQFAAWEREALALGFDHVASAPLVRSSYLAERALDACGIKPGVR